MTDIFSKEKRSWIMSRVRGKHTSVEETMVRRLKRHGHRFKQHYRIGPGTTSIDIAFPELKVAVFIDGDFWHGHDWKRLQKKLKHNKFWLEKIRRNRERDKKVTSRLRRSGWSVMRFWEHEIRKRPDTVIRTIEHKLGKPRKAK